MIFADALSAPLFTDGGAFFTKVLKLVHFTEASDRDYH